MGMFITIVGVTVGGGILLLCACAACMFMHSTSKMGNDSEIANNDGATSDDTCKSNTGTLATSASSEAKDPFTNAVHASDATVEVPMGHDIAMPFGMSNDGGHATRACC